MLKSARRAMIARLLLVGAAALTMGAQTRCSAAYGDPDPVDDPTQGSGAGPTFTTTLAVKDSAGNLATRFRRGELVRFELTVTNRTAAPATVSFSSGALTDFLVFDAGSHALRWRWSEGKFFVQVLSDLTFQPNETKTFAFDWDQVLASGAMPTPGDYDARGLVLHVGTDPNPLARDELASVLVPFTIIR